MLHQSTYLRGDEALVDISELTEDSPELIARAGFKQTEHGQFWQEADYMDGRWAHMLDAHVAEQSLFNRELSTWEKSEDFSVRSFSARQREDRFMRLSWWLEKMRVKVSIANPRTKRRLQEQIVLCMKGIKERRIASIKLVLSRKKDEWFLLYITKEQYDDILVLAKDAWKGR